MTLTSAPGIDEVMHRVVKTAPSAKSVATSLISSRHQQQLASREIERGLQRLASLGITQRDIAALAGLSQAEVSRRLKRKQLTTDVERLREIVSRRESGEMTSSEMMDALTAAVKPHRKPGRLSAYDGSSTSSRTIAELMQFYKSGAITRDEYTGVRTRLARRQKSR